MIEEHEKAATMIRALLESHQAESALKPLPLPPTNPSIMNKIISLILLAAGAALIIYGINATNSIGSDFSRFFTGSPTKSPSGC